MNLPSPVQVAYPYVSSVSIGGRRVNIQYVECLKKSSSFVYKVEVVADDEFKAMLPQFLTVKYVALGTCCQ
eukprot:scaffold7939_cov189-Ochromonas_danica.AAC.4